MVPPPPTTTPMPSAATIQGQRLHRDQSCNKLWRVRSKMHSSLRQTKTSIPPLRCAFRCFDIAFFFSCVSFLADTAVTWRQFRRLSVMCRIVHLFLLSGACFFIFFIFQGHLHQAPKCARLLRQSLLHRKGLVRSMTSRCILVCERGTKNSNDAGIIL